MRLSTQLSLLVGVLLAACGDDDCPRIETEKSFPKQLTRDQLCAAETDGKVAYESDNNSNAAPRVRIESDRCAALCGDSEINTCEIPNDKQGAYGAIYSAPGGRPDGGAPSSPCPYADAVGAIVVSCAQNVSKGRFSENCPSPIAGRRFAGYTEAAAAEGAPAVARYLASCAHLEAASVVAFDALAEELAFHGVPRDLVDDCRAAAREEVEHTASVGALARSFGAQPCPVAAPSTREPRAVVDIAIENAVEGMVRELFGAAEAHWRAARAADGAIRAAMVRIAEDESRHAELSMRIGDCLHARLGAGSREKVRAAAAAARVDLRRQLACAEVHPSLVAIAGVPSREAALALFDALEREVWQAA